LTLRFLFRLAATIALAVAVIMAVLDATRTVAASHLVLTPLRESWGAVSPHTLQNFQNLTQTKINALAWDPVAVTVLNLPGFAVFAALAFLLYAIGHRPRRRRRDFAVEP
jgi:inosine-uridine nucleoside N-ribohydrolase